MGNSVVSISASTFQDMDDLFDIGPQAQNTSLGTALPVLGPQALCSLSDLSYGSASSSSHFYVAHQLPTFSFAAQKVKKPHKDPLPVTKFVFAAKKL